MKLIIEIMGCGLIVLALIHAVFPKVFDWKKELAGLSLINQQLMTVHTFFIALAVFLNGLLCVTCADELMNTSLGRKLCLGLSCFWGVRFIAQIFWYSPMLWRGKRLETFCHVLFLFIWSSVTGVFLFVGLGEW